ncbi:hypothetical protein [Ottowia sp.]|uniref:hypothetical protein n=1 Tax=Ottowia sp. TaxID=1898956 RepID=UPI0039E47AB2
MKTTSLNERHCMQQALAPRAQLCIWTGVDPDHEADFNRWYDREHMQERVAIRGFQSARRLRALDAGPRPYLALYDTEDIGVFTSAAYRQAFTKQTEWSLRNFARMRNTQRRVGQLVVEAGEGEGAFAAVAVLPAMPAEIEPLRVLLEGLCADGDAIHASVLATDVPLSTPLTAGAEAPPADAVVMVEYSTAEAARAHAPALAAALGVAAASIHFFQTLWRLGAR